MTRLLHLKNYWKMPIWSQCTAKKMQTLATEMFRVYKGISPNIMTEVFQLSQPFNYNRRHRLKGAYYGTESLC